jgi:hypothetical protein
MRCAGQVAAAAAAQQHQLEHHPVEMTSSSAQPLTRRKNTISTAIDAGEVSKMPLMCSWSPPDMVAAVFCLEAAVAQSLVEAECQ